GRGCRGASPLDLVAGVDAHGAGADDVAMAEYAMVTAAVALLAVTLAGTVGKTSAQFPRSQAAAIQLVSSNARAKKVSVAGARAAYGKAPYRKAALKYVYAVGWITGTHDRASCLYTVSTSD